MPTIIRKPVTNVMETRRDVLLASRWPVHSNVWTPPTDVYEADANLIVKLEIAGVREEDIEVTVEEQVLLIRGNRLDQNERRAYHQMEIRFGKFEIAIGLPSDINVEESSAHYKDGFLTIILPKKQAKQIEVE
ncbi:MAG TPA: Hsp20/alpha crystallin family protein [Anaerolineales bacterium]|nr:Hsp20/alpha crystallin family protein [Anaerolineales bacterium]